MFAWARVPVAVFHVHKYWFSVVEDVGCSCVTDSCKYSCSAHRTQTFCCSFFFVQSCSPFSWIDANERHETERRKTSSKAVALSCCHVVMKANGEQPTPVFLQSVIYLRRNIDCSRRNVVCLCLQACSSHCVPRTRSCFCSSCANCGDVGNVFCVVSLRKTDVNDLTMSSNYFLS